MSQKGADERKIMVLKFRNYKPQTEIPESVVLNKNVNNDDDNVDVEGEVDLSEPYKEEDSIRLAPREMNGDLKKGLESKLRELEDRTKLAIFHMLTQEMSENTSS